MQTFDPNGKGGIFFRPHNLLYRMSLETFGHRKSRLKAMKRSRSTLRRLGYNIPKA